MKGVSQAQKDECAGLMKWAKKKLSEKYEKAKIEIAENCPKRNQPKICEHVDAGVETICAILGMRRIYRFYKKNINFRKKCSKIKMFKITKKKEKYLRKAKFFTIIQKL